MSRWNEDRLPDDLLEVVSRLRDGRPEATALELDRIKLRAMAQASSSRPKGYSLRSRVIVSLLTLGMMAGGTGGVIAAAGGNGNGNGKANGSANSQYCPPSSPAAGKPKNPPPGNKCGQGGDKGKCNAGRGNGSEGCDPGNSSTSGDGSTGQNMGGDEGGPISGGTGAP